MAFSLLLRNAACSGQISQQLRRLATQPSLHRAVAATLPIKNITITQANSTPILNAVRAFTTTQPLRSDHDHSRLWVIEKGVTALLVPLIPLMLFTPHKALDIAVSILITAHSFWSLEAMVVEYVRELLFGTFVPMVAHAVAYALTLGMLAGLMYLNLYDIGLSRAFWRVWHSLRGVAPRK